MLNQYLPQAMGMPLNPYAGAALGMPGVGGANALGSGINPFAASATGQPMQNAAPVLPAGTGALGATPARPMMAFQPNMPSAPMAAAQGQPQGQSPGMLGSMGGGNLAALQGLIGQLRGVNGGAGTTPPSVLPNSTSDLGAMSTDALRNQFLSQTGQAGGLSGLLGMLHG